VLGHPLLAIALAIAAPALAGVSLYRFQVHPNSAIRVRGLLHDRNVIWIAADDGLHQFNGARFTKVDHYPFPSARFVEAGQQGTIWVGGEQGLAKLEDGRFHVIVREKITGLSVNGNEVLYATDRIHRMRPDGAPLPVAPMPAEKGFLAERSGRLFLICEAGRAVCTLDPRLPGSNSVTTLLKLPGDLDQAVGDSQGRIWVNSGSEVSVYQGGSLVEKYGPRADGKPYRISADREGQVWILGDSVRGISPKLELKVPTRYRKYEPTSATSPGGWVALAGLGLVRWALDPSWKRWASEDFEMNEITQVIESADGTIFAASHGNLHRLDAGADRWVALGSRALHYRALLPLGQGGFLASVKGRGLVRVNQRGEIVETVDDPQKQPDWFRDIARDGEGRIWVGSVGGLFLLTGHPGSYRLLQQPLPAYQPNDPPQAVAIEVDERGAPWVGYSGGLLTLDAKGVWNKVGTEQPVERVRSFALAGDEIWVAHRRDGPFSHLRKEATTWRVTRFAPDEGYGPPGTHFFARDSRGWIWRGTENGVYVSDGKNWSPGDWLHFNGETELGTGSMDIQGFLEERSGRVWIAGAEGIVSMQPRADWLLGGGGRTPAIRRILSDGREVEAGTAVAGGLVQFEVGAAHAIIHPIHAFPLQYRLRSEAPTWRYSPGLVLEFHGLKPGQHTLEAFFSGSQPGPPLNYSFEVAEPPISYFSPWLAALPVALGGIFMAARRGEFYQRARYRLWKKLYLLRHSQSAASASPLATEIGGKYTIGRLVSRGGFASVYEAADPAAPDVPLAVKVLTVRGGREGWTRDRFLSEVAALQAIRHPGVVPIHDWWIAPSGEPCLAMPYLDGPTLRAALKDGPLAPARAVRIARQLGSALSAIHDKGIVHRDVKPENIIVTRPGDSQEQAVLIDFGTAGLRAAERELALTSVVAGSWQYMAPELLTGHYSPVSDIYSLGSILLEMISGVRLSDLPAHSSTGGFEGELAKALSRTLPKVRASSVAHVLRPAFHSDPALRPARLKQWVEEVCARVQEQPS
jgi:ligand-binding sensor domain-containing protein